MKKTAAMLLLLLLLTGCGNRLSRLEAPTAPQSPPTSEPVTEATTEPTLSPEALTDREFRPAYGQGNCRTMAGELPVLVFFLDDDAGSWNENRVRYFLEETVRPGLDYLEMSAWDWEVELYLECIPFYTDDDHTLRYPGVYDPSPDSTSIPYDPMAILSECLGFSDRYKMDRYFRDNLGREELLYFLVVPGSGTSYTLPDDDDDGFEQVEYSVLFSRYNDGTPVSAFTVAHEAMHLFGAEDYYDPYGDLPRRKALCEELYPDDLMLRWDADVNNLSVSDVTAYTVGWTDRIPEVVYWPEWWR